MKPYEPPTFPPWTGQVAPLSKKVGPFRVTLIDPPPRKRHRPPNPWIIGIGTALMVMAIIALALAAARTIDVIGTCAIERWMR